MEGVWCAQAHIPVVRGKVSVVHSHSFVVFAYTSCIRAPEIHHPKCRSG